MGSKPLKVGDIVWATVIEILDSREVILRLEGEDVASKLLRVANQTSHLLAVGDQIRVKVVDVKPLRFQQIPETRRKSGRIDVSV